MTRHPMRQDTVGRNGWIFGVTCFRMLLRLVVMWAASGCQLMVQLDSHHTARLTADMNFDDDDDDPHQPNCFQPDGNVKRII
jgi:hypothetical protein